MKILDKSQLLERTERPLVLPDASRAAGEAIAVRIRRVSASEYRELIPTAPPEAEMWPKNGPARIQAELDWMATLPVPVATRRREEMLEASHVLVSRALLEPAMTADEVARLGDDALFIFAELIGWMTERAAAKAIEPGVAVTAPPAADVVEAAA